MNMAHIAAPLQADIAFQANLYEDSNPTRRGLHLSRREWVETALVLNLPPQGSVIEVGIGCGIFTRFLSSIGARTTAVDINPAFVMGVQDLNGVTPVIADATADLDMGLHDLALCSEVLEHVPPERSAAMLKNLHSALKPGGLLILTTPQRFASVELMARLLKFPPVLAVARRLYGTADELGHINLLTAGQLEVQLRHAGFAIESHTRFGFYLPFIAEFGGQAGWRTLRAIERVIRHMPLLKGLIWTQAYVLRKM